MKSYRRHLLFLFMIFILSACASNAHQQAGQQSNAVTIYNITSIPTVFSKSKQMVPIVTLEWARATSNFLEVDILIAGLDKNINIDNLICDPYFQSNHSLQSDIMTRNVKQNPGRQGKSVELTYEYKLNSPLEVKSLDLDMDITLGPCAKSINFQESNVTPSAIPDLISNYHFHFSILVR